jgi:hypothetical protein
VPPLTPRRLPQPWIELIEKQLAAVKHAGKTIITVEHGASGVAIDLTVQPPALRASACKPSSPEGVVRPRC